MGNTKTKPFAIAHHRRVDRNQTITFRGHRYPVAFEIGCVVWVEPLPLQNVLRIQPLHESPPSTSASASPLRNRGRIDRVTRTDRRWGNLTSADKVQRYRAGRARRGAPPAMSQARRYADIVDIAPEEAAYWVQLPETAGE